ncbi:class I SAM-dependent rRNA methyltransferase [Bryobacter aggregatus]|uniref:class I SAM-dependent rRNA methyltransferase n=1 Tax=Bryobacter aggregatus TaxID=360054 RepID=UPI0009B5AD76|nr:RsmD family RNA methyltransferase [Bryobacter aggregatus]
MKRLRVSRKAAQRLEAGHQWVYRGEMAGDLEADALESVLLCDERGRLLGSALVDARSPVPVRLYSRKETAFDQTLLEARVDKAVAWRQRVVAPDSTGYRMIFSEADGLPGLTVDRFGDSLAFQCNSRNYISSIEIIADRIWDQFGREKNTGCVVSEEGETRRLVRGDTSSAKSTYLLNGFTMQADLLDGPKTGAFLDQRENYLAVSHWAKLFCPEGNALDLYSSSGGFALHLARVTKQVDAVDSSATSIQTIAGNAERNEIQNVRAIQSDVKQFLRGLGQARRRYNCVVADPPAFAKSVQKREEAARAYYDLNLRALSVTAPAGLFVTCSCSRAMNEEDFVAILRQCAAESRRSLSFVDKRRQSSDHRESLLVPETSYLKCLIFRVDD